MSRWALQNEVEQIHDSVFPLYTKTTPARTARVAGVTDTSKCNDADSTCSSIGLQLKHMGADVCHCTLQRIKLVKRGATSLSMKDPG